MGIVVINALKGQEAQQACTAYVRGYAHERATVAEMHVYAGCIDRLHPQPMTREQLIAAKFFVLMVFMGMVAGLVHYRRDGASWLESVFFGCLLGAGCVFLGVIGIVGISHMVRLLIS